MKIAVIGPGNVGSVLGRRWAEGGHQVTFGARNPADPKSRSISEKARIGIASVASAAASAEVVVLTTPWGAVQDALAAAGDLSDKVLLDCTCPLTPDLTGLEMGTHTSGGEFIARHAAGAKVVKIFCTTGADNVANPVYGKTKLTMLYCGDDPDAKQVGAQLAAELGFDPIDVGPLSAARVLEPFGLLWVTLAIHRKFGTDFALNVVRRCEK
jgi:predicted dinucleotide-binding enzyme